MSRSSSRSFALLLILPLLVPAGAPASILAQESGTPVATPTIAVAEFVWESSGGETPLSFPMDVTVDPEGNVWVVDMGNSQFQIFSPEGAFLDAWGSGGSGPGQFDFFDGPIVEESPYGGDVAFDRDGNIFVADLDNNRIQKFGPDREFITEWGGEGFDDGQFQYPWSLDIDEQGNVFVADYGRNDVQVFDSNGAYLRTLTSFADGGGEVASVTIDPEGNVWVSGYPNRLVKLTPQGEELTVVEDAGAGPAQFAYPNVGDAVDGYVFVADVGNHRVQILTGEGTHVASWGSQGSGPGEMNFPVGVALDDEGGIYVADIGNNRIQKFRLLVPLPW